MQGPIIAPPGSHPVAWMNIPDCLRPKELNFTRTFLRSLSYSQLFKGAYDNNNLLDRVERVAKRALAAVATLVLATLDTALGITVIPLLTRSFATLGPSLAMLPLSVGMVSGYLPPTKGQDHVLSGAEAYAILRKDDQKLHNPEDYGANAARGVLTHAYQAFEVSRDHPGRDHDYINDALVLASEQGNVRGIEVLINDGKGNPNIERFGKRSLVLAAANCHVASVKMLLKNGADLQSRNSLNGLDAITALLLGVQDRYIEKANYGRNRLSASQPTSTLEQVATELVFAEMPFNLQHVEELSIFVKALKERNKEKLSAWCNAQEQAFHRALNERQIHVKDITQWGELINQLSQGEAAVNPFFVYMKGVMTRKASAGEDEKGADWVKASLGKKEDVDAFVTRFERVRDALYKARREVIWKREQAIIQACPSFPEAGLPNIISEQCYS